MILCALLVTAGLSAGSVAHAAPSTYYYFNDFETNTAGAPAGWSGTSVDEVPSGHAGVSAGPSGGATFLKTDADAQLNFPYDGDVDTGTFSQQVDFYANPSGPMTPRFINSYTRQPGEQVNILVAAPFVYPAGPTYTVQDYYGPFGAVGVPSGAWYTLEVYYDYSSEIDPTTGRPGLEQVWNLYTQASFDAAGYRRSENLIATHRGTYSHFGSPQLTVAGDKMHPWALGLSGSGAFYIDNVGVGPIINIPEPASGALLIGLLVVGRRSRR